MMPKRNNNGRLPAYEWPGGYPFVYVAADGGYFCAPCANNENGSDAFVCASGKVMAGDEQWAILGADIHWEGEPLQCSHCYTPIESAYGNPNATD